MTLSEQFKNEMKENNEYNLLILIKKNMKYGELQVDNLSSKQRSYLHKFAQKHNFTHYSIGNYNNRIFVFKDNQHLYYNTPYKYQTIIDKYSDKPNLLNKWDTFNTLVQKREKGVNEEINNSEAENDTQSESEEESEAVSESEVSSGQNRFTVGERVIYLVGLGNLGLNLIILGKISG